ncbi:MAG TPA: hypothetical protein VK871_05570, partial [Candidatus Limnocylindrales bacterium]|nr:hypothetical protein [Candidatus Limnocylindrales bacterium]
MAERDLDALMRRMAAARVNRRGFLAGSGLAGLSAFIAACTSGGGATASPGGSAASAAPSGSAAASASAVPVEGALYMFNWADYVDLDNIEEFKSRFGVTDFTYDTFASNEELLTRLGGGATGQWDIGAPTAEFVEAMVEGEYIQELDFSKIPNAALINPSFQQFFDPASEQGKYNDYHL